MRYILFALSLSLTSIAFASEVKVGVRGMVCAFCAQGIEKKFKEQSEVDSINVSLENKYITIKYKEGKSLPQDRITQLLKDSGYEAVFEN
jgi:mercuric ion binding protein